MIPWRGGRGATLPFFSPRSPTRGHCSIQSSKQRRGREQARAAWLTLPVAASVGCGVLGADPCGKARWPDALSAEGAEVVLCARRASSSRKAFGTADQVPIESAPPPSSRALDRSTAQAVGSGLRFSSQMDDSDGCRMARGPPNRGVSRACSAGMSAILRAQRRHDSEELTQTRRPRGRP